MKKDVKTEGNDEKVRITGKGLKKECKSEKIIGKKE